MNMTNNYSQQRTGRVCHWQYNFLNSLDQYLSLLTMLFMLTLTGISNAQNTSLYATSPIVEPQEVFKVEIKTSNFQNVVGMQMTLEWNENVIEFQGLQELDDFALPMFDAADFNPEPPNKLRVVWFDFNLTGADLTDNTTVFSATFKAIGDHGDTSHVSFVNEPVAIEISTQTGVLPVDITNGVVTIDNPNNTQNALSANEWTVAQAFPNPFFEFTEIPLTFKETTTVDFRIYDVSGKEIYYDRKALSSGSQRVRFDQTLFPEPGAYYLLIEAAGKQVTRELIFAKKN